jgi:hypothetical protein
MAQGTVGQSAKEAVLFLRELHGDVAAMVRSLDGLLEKRGWITPTKYQNRIAGAALANQLQYSERWVLPSVYRMYTPLTEVDSAHRILLFQVDFVPGAFDQAIVLVAMVKFATPSSPDAIWNGWESSAAVEAFLAHGPASAPLPSDTWSETMVPGASEVSAFVVPLDSLVDDATLQSSLVEPALRALG